MFHIYLFVSFCFFIEFCLSKERIDGILAIVGENMVLHSDVLQQAQFLALEQRVDPIKSPYMFEEIYIRMRNNIINQYALLDVAEKDTNIVISNDDVDRALDRQIKEFISYIKKWITIYRFMSIKKNQKFVVFYSENKNYWID